MVVCRFKFIVGGSEETCRLTKEGSMGKPSALSERQAESLYTQYVMGESVADLAAAYGIGESTARHYIAEMRKKKEGDSAMASRSKIVAGDKHNGRLTSTPDPHRYRYIIKDGKKEKLCH